MIKTQVGLIKVFNNDPCAYLMLQTSARIGKGPWQQRVRVFLKEKISAYVNICFENTIGFDTR